MLYSKAAEPSQKDSEVQVAILLHCFREDALGSVQYPRDSKTRGRRAEGVGIQRRLHSKKKKKKSFGPI